MSRNISVHFSLVCIQNVCIHNSDTVFDDDDDDYSIAIFIFVIVFLILFIIILFYFLYKYYKKVRDHENVLLHI